MQKKVTVITAGRLSSTGRFMLACKDDETGEGYVLLQRGPVVEAKAGDLGVITFKPGGPTGGYWEYEKLESQGI
jgi:hypothetical protein